MVEGAPLLREYTRDGIEGSNPFLSAISLDFVVVGRLDGDMPPPWPGRRFGEPMMLLSLENRNG